MRKTKLHVVDIDGGGKHLLINCKVNENKSVLLIDTGASNSIFDINSGIFNSQNFTPISGDITSSGFNSNIEGVCVGETLYLKIGHFKAKIDNAIFTSLEHVNMLYADLKLPKIIGILGSDFLLKHKAIIDFSQELLFFKKND